MNRTIFASLLLPPLIMLLSGCKIGGSNEPPIFEQTITHSYEVTSSSPIELSFISISEKSITFNGTDEKTQLLNKDVRHSGSSIYKIYSKTPTLASSMSITCTEPVKVTYKWTEYQNGKKTKTDTQEIDIDGEIFLYPTKDYITSLNK